ncbi:MAG: ATP-binding protein, partial [Rhodobacteraceae bacterium]|nr:ATP-binding protein [Paracoccaceae bacterium]
VIVGTNGSGKSSILQAMHWMFQSGRNPKVQANRKTSDGATLSQLDATYMPSPDYRNAGHEGEYGNFQGAPRMEVEVSATNGGASLTANMWLKSARNEGISVHIPSSNDFVAFLRDRSREFSAYIPGLAGIPLSEEKRSTGIVRRQAAAGDANTVLRNILHILHEQTDNSGKTGLETVQHYVSQVMGDLVLKVAFADENDYRIDAQFQTGAMRAVDPRRFKPLELAGIGFLQVIQIFAYLVYFRPVLLLVDEPDSHLHPGAQEKLVRTLHEAASAFDAQVILTTHSPSVVRALPAASQVIWMKEGAVQPGGNEFARQQMGWGLLDKSILLLTEDKDTSYLRRLLEQWPDLERKVAIWPMSGSANIPTPDVVEALANILGGHMRIVLHRDRDFMMPVECDHFCKPYADKGISVWLTKYSDIEAYWADSALLAAHFNLSDSDARALLSAAVSAENFEDKALRKRRSKRADMIKKLQNGVAAHLPQYGDNDILTETTQGGRQYAILGKDMLSALRKAAQDQKLAGVNGFGKSIPAGMASCLAPDLRVLLEQL